MIRFIIKAGLAATAVYYVKEQGIWKNSDKSIEAGNKLKLAVKPYVDDVKAQIPIELPKIPQTENTFQLMKEYWNLGIRSTFSFLVNLPDHTKNGYTTLVEKPEIKKFLDSFSSNNDISKAK